MTKQSVYRNLQTILANFLRLSSFKNKILQKKHEIAKQNKRKRMAFIVIKNLNKRATAL